MRDIDRAEACTVQPPSADGLPDLNTATGNGISKSQETAFLLRLGLMRGLTVDNEVSAFCGASIQSFEQALDNGHFTSTTFSMYRSDDKPATNVTIFPISGRVSEEIVPYPQHHLFTVEDAITAAQAEARKQAFTHAFIQFLGADTKDYLLRVGASVVLPYAEQPEKIAEFWPEFEKYGCWPQLQRFGKEKVMKAMEFAAYKRGGVLALSGRVFETFRVESLPGGALSAQVPDDLPLCYTKGLEMMSRDEGRDLLALLRAKG